MKYIVYQQNSNKIISQSKGRNLETSEVYRTVAHKSTNFTYINNLPEDSWGNAYF